ncbi:hypothetical protein QR77_02905 [Streptomyces sp. 150FB]|nr:hypothetical protein QR77_02905 [Streptomyces sp. 150FB]
MRPPWLDVRLTFADGARLDVLAVVSDGRIAIEDAQADPPLALDGFAALAGVIRAPLQDACQVVTGRPVLLVDDDVADRVAPVDQVAQPVQVAQAEPVGDAVTEQAETGGDAGVRIDDGDGDGSGSGAEAPGTGTEPAPSGRRRARQATPRGAEGRRGAAEVYRAAQREGRDPVLAVMAATGLSRRKSLRLIAAARDEGHLTPRHHRR